MKKYTKKIKQWHKPLNLKVLDLNKNKKDKLINKTKKHCLTDNNVLQLCESGKFSKYINKFYNKENINKFNIYVTQLDEKYKNYRKFTIPMEKRTKYLADKFKLYNDRREKNREYIKNNYYDYINDQWSKETIIEDKPTFYVQIDNFRVIQEKVYYQMMDYVKTYIKENSKTEKAIAIKNLHTSLTTNTSHKQLLKHCQEILQEVEEFFNPNTLTNVYDLLTDLNRNEIISWGSPIQWQLLPDEKNVTKYISHLSSAQLSIYDYLIYIDDPADDTETKKYKSYIKYNFLKCII